MTYQPTTPAPDLSEAPNDVSVAPMGRLEFATPRSAWGGEATDFTTLLGNDEMLGYLGDECGIGPLSVVEIDHATACDRTLDILAETMDGRRVAIENHYGLVGHDHLTRGLAGAVAVEARGLVIVAEDHPDEFQSVASYLNRVGGLDDDGIKVWLVQVRAVRRVGDTTWSPQFVVMAEPDEWQGAQRLRSRGHHDSDEFSPGRDEQTGQNGHDRLHMYGRNGHTLGYAVAPT